MVTSLPVVAFFGETAAWEWWEIAVFTHAGSQLVNFVWYHETKCHSIWTSSLGYVWWWCLL